MSDIADCLTVALTTQQNDIGTSGTPVSVTLDYTRNEFQPPSSIALLEGGVKVQSLTLTSPPASKPASYGGVQYRPSPDLDGPLTLKAVAVSAVAGVTPEVSDSKLVNVDTRSPRIAVTYSCGTPSHSPCLRDDVLTVSATLDETHLVLPVNVSLDLDGYTTVTAMDGTYPSFFKDLPLKLWPFGAFTRDIVIRVTATDSFGNTSVPPVPPWTVPSVTRDRSTKDVGAAVAVTSPAVEDSGTIVYGVGGSSGQLQAINPDKSLAWATTLEISSGQGQALKAAPAVGSADIFAGSEDGRVYRVGLDGSIPGGTARFPSTTDTTAVPFNPLYTPVINVLAADHSYSVGGAGVLYQFYSNQSTATLSLGNPAHGAGVFSGSSPFFATSDGIATTLHRISDIVLAPLESTPPLAVADTGTPPVPCDNVQVPLAVDGSGSIIIACHNGQVHRVVNAAPLAPGFLITLPASPTGSPVILADGGILIPTSDGRLVKLVPGTPTTVAWSVPLASGHVIVGVAAAEATAGAPTIYVTTDQGLLAAMSDTGVVRWSNLLENGAYLGFPTIAPVPGAPPPPSALPTLYVGSSNGKLFRVVVDSGLDATAPWPKAHHDIRNTGSNSSLLP